MRKLVFHSFIGLLFFLTSHLGYAQTAPVIYPVTVSDSVITGYVQQLGGTVFIWVNTGAATAETRVATVDTNRNFTAPGTGLKINDETI